METHEPDELRYVLVLIRTGSRHLTARLELENGQWLPATFSVCKDGKMMEGEDEVAKER